MSTQKRKFELFARLTELGFTYDEAHALRRIEMTRTTSTRNARCAGSARSTSSGKPT